MKNIDKLIKLIFLFTLTLNVKEGFAQNFYDDFVKYEDARTKPREHVSKSKLHSIHVQFASECKRVFYEVKRKTGFYMLGSDTLYFFEKDKWYSEGYSKLIWNDKHSCYYENPRFSPIDNYKKMSLKIESDAQVKLSALGPILKRIIQNADTVGYLKYIQSSEIRLCAGIRFMVATEGKKHWHFVSSRSFASTPPD
jgi:hypothetical protein